MMPTGFIVMGVADSGKTTMGKALAEKLGLDFFDADDFHPAENIAKMAAGIPLNDSDRTPWLATLSDLLFSMLKAGRHPVLACSALKESYRGQLLKGKDKVEVIYLKGSYDLLLGRLAGRQEHLYEARDAKKPVCYARRAQKRAYFGCFDAAGRNAGFHV
jgi:gluconokinase